MFKLTPRTIVLAVVPLILFVVLGIGLGRRPKLLPGLGGNVTAIAFSPDGQTLVCATNNNFVQAWLPELKRWRSFESNHNYMTNLPALFVKLRFSPDGQTLYGGGSSIDRHYSSVAHAWDTKTRQRKYAFNYLKSPAFDISPDGRWAALGYRDVVHLIDLKSEPVKIPPERATRYDDFRMFRPRQLKATGNVTCVAFSPDNQTLVVGSEMFSWQSAFWSVETGQRLLPTAPGAPAGIVPTFMEWSPDGKVVAAADAPAGAAQLTLYEVASQTARTVELPDSAPAPGRSHSYLGGIIPLAWSPDGTRIFTGGAEVQRWRASDLKLEYSYGVSGPVAISPDGRTLATAAWSDAGATQSGLLLWKLN